MDRAFEGLNVVVTGGTGSLGSAVVARLASAGARCWATCLHERELERFERGEEVEVVSGLDLSGERAAVDLYNRFDEDTPLWASIHVAGGFGMSKIAETSRDDWDEMMAMNATSCFLCCREAIRAMRQAQGDRARRAVPPGGRIVNVAARPALRPEQGSGMSAYASSKAAVAVLTGALADEVKDEDILVNAVVPSILDTPANRKAMPDADHDSWAKVDEVAETIAFLASPANRLTHGALAPVYGRS